MTAQWVKVSGPYSAGNEAAGPNSNQGWWKGVCLTDGRTLLSCGPISVAPNCGTYLFDPATGQWTRTNTDTTNFWKNIGPAENYGMAWDSDDGCAYKSIGSPNAWTIGGNQNTSPQYGELRYEPPPTDEWFTDYPHAGVTYRPTTPDEIAHWDLTNLGNTFTVADCSLEYWNHALYTFQSWSTNAGLKARDMATGTVTVLETSSPAATEPSRLPQLRGGLDHRKGIAWVTANGLELYTRDLTLPAHSGWIHQPTTNIPTTPQPPGVGIGSNWGILTQLDETSGYWIAYAGMNASVVIPGMTAMQTTWMLDPATWAWTNLEITAPTAKAGVLQNLLYNPGRGCVQLLLSNLGVTEVWELRGLLSGSPTGGTGPTGPTGPTGGLPGPLGIVSQYPLPRSSGGVYGVNYYGFPFTSNGGSKQSDMAYCPLNNRIYAQGGDTIHSATDGTWSVNATTVDDWRLDVGQAAYPTLPAPHALQDDFGIAWVAARKQFLLWPGQYKAYEVAGTPVLNYTGGLWWFDPVANVYTQDTRLFPNKPTGGVSPGQVAPGTGNPYGGLFDEVNNQIVTFADSSTSYGVRRWDVNAMVELPFEKLAIDPPSGYPKAKAAYFRSKPIKVGRLAYFVGYSTDGSTLRLPRMWLYDLDAHGLAECASPPIVGSLYRELEAQLNTSQGKVVWLFTNCPQGGLLQPDGTVLPLQIWIYDPAANLWTQDTQPLPASFFGNVTCSLPDGRIAIAGSSFGTQQTMFNFYQLTPTSS